MLSTDLALEWFNSIAPRLLEFKAVTMVEVVIWVEREKKKSHHICPGPGGGME